MGQFLLRKVRSLLAQSRPEKREMDRRGRELGGSLVMGETGVERISICSLVKVKDILMGGDAKRKVC